MQPPPAVHEPDSGVARRGPTARPRFLELHRLSYPPGAVVSIAHRVTGLLLALATPFAAFVFARSLAGPDEFAAIAAWLRSLPARLVLAVLFGALAFHLFAGVRHLLMDAGIGTSLRSGRASAWTVAAAGATGFVAALVALLR